jgi:hypothetical protein
MKRLLIALFLLFPLTAHAQVGPEVYRIATPAQVSSFVTAKSYAAMTQSSITQMMEVTCQTAACSIWINISGVSIPATTATGIYLPTDTPRRFSTSKGSTVWVIGNGGAGTIHIQELTK